MSIVDSPVVEVTGGVDTHLDVHVAAALDPIGGLLGVESFDTTQTGFEALLARLTSFGEVNRVGVEGTGSYGAGLARFLTGHDIEVIEVDRPNGQERSRKGKSDPVDAVEAARAALSGRATGLAKTKDGPVIRALLVLRRSARKPSDLFAGADAPSGVLCSPGPAGTLLRHHHRGAGEQATGLRPRADGDQVTYATKLALKSLAKRVQLLNDQIKQVRKRKGRAGRRPSHRRHPWLGRRPTGRRRSQKTRWRPHPRARRRASDGETH